jgi:hypothetical protein
MKTTTNKLLFYALLAFATFSFQPARKDTIVKPERPSEKDSALPVTKPDVPPIKPVSTIDSVAINRKLLDASVKKTEIITQRINTKADRIQGKLKGIEENIINAQKVDLDVEPIQKSDTTNFLIKKHIPASDTQETKRKRGKLFRFNRSKE